MTCHWEDSDIAIQEMWSNVSPLSTFIPIPASSIFCLFGEREMDARCTHADLSRRQSFSSVLLLPFEFCDLDSSRVNSSRLGIGPLESQLLAYEWRRYLIIKEGFKRHALSLSDRPETERGVG